jgi:hypothetical protein
MSFARNVPSKNLVIGTESLPAQFRPSNQLRLEPSRATNPAFHASTSFMPSFLEYQGANQWGDMGLGAKVQRSGNRPLGPKARQMPGPAPTRLPTTDARSLALGAGAAARVPQMSAAGVSEYVEAPAYQAVGGISATSPWVLGPLGLGILGIAAYFILRKKGR